MGKRHKFAKIEKTAYRYKPLATFVMFTIRIPPGLMSAVKILEDFTERNARKSQIKRHER